MSRKPKHVRHDIVGNRFIRWLHDNSLSIVFFGLFMIALAGQSITGVRAYNQQLQSYHLPAVSFGAYLHTGNFLDGICSNWQAAIFQLACLIVFGARLHQKGAAHSRKPEGDSKQKQKQDGDRQPWIYRNSLSLAFALMFLLSFVGHACFGARSYNETRALIGNSAMSTSRFIGSSQFWFTTLQTWQAEFIAIGAYIVLSIFLRQQGSAESKPVESSDKETGETNK